MDNKRKKICTPCKEGGSSVLQNELDGFLRKYGEWKVFKEEERRYISCVFSFPDFAEALAFVNEIGREAEYEGHHPQLVLNWGLVEVAWWTHKINNIHNNDLLMAEVTSKKYAELKN